MTTTPAMRPRPWKRLASHVRHELREQRRPIGVACCALIAEVCLRLLEPWPIRVVFDYVLPGAKLPLPLWIPQLSPMWLAALAAVAVLLFVGLRALAGYVQTVALALAANRVLTSLRAALFRRLQFLPLSFHQSARAGDLTVRLTSDVGMLQDVALTAALPLLADAFVLVGMIGLMLWLHPTLTLIALVPVPLFLVRWRRTQRSIRDVSRVQRRREGAMAASVAESFSAIKTVQALALEHAVGKAFTSANVKGAAEGVKAKRLAAGLERSVDLLIALSTGILLWLGATYVMEGRMTPGELLVFLSYLKTALKPLQSFAKYTSRLGKATAAAERVVEVLDKVPEIADRPGAVVAPRFAGKITFDSVRFGYTDGSPVLQDVSFDVAPGQLVAVVGRSGAGKTTIANLLMRLYEPTRGRVCIDDRDIRDFTLASLRSQVGVVLQDTVLFAGSIRDNITLGAGAVPDDLVQEALEIANADEFVQALPQGLDTPVGERGVTLSNGQRQRLAIARAVVRRTPLLILDEPTVGLDEENDTAVSEALIRLAKGRTTFLITHALHLAARADVVIVVGEGRIMEMGTPHVLLNGPGTFASWHSDQSCRLRQVQRPVSVSHAAAR